MELSELVAGLIQLKWGGAVERQFKDSFVNWEDVEAQNKNAIRYIGQTLDELIDEELLNDQHYQYNDLVDYLEEINEYLEK